jgi:hypothetical protein
MEVTQAIGEGLTFEKVWAAIQATDRQIKETGLQMKETDLKIKENDRQIKENWLQIEATNRQMKETDRQMKETDKRISKLSNRFGEVIEYMVVPNLVAGFRELGFEFTKAHRDTEIVDREHDIIMEVDALLENGDKVMAVEIKSKPDTRDIDDHIERMEKLRKYADLHGDKRKYLGAVGGVVISDSVSIYALKNGFYVIEPSGETFKIIEPKGKYHPREW